MTRKARTAVAWAVLDDEEVIRVERFRYLAREFVSIQPVPGLRVVPLYLDARLSPEVRRVLEGVAHREHDINAANVIREFLRRA